MFYLPFLFAALAAPVSPGERGICDRYGCKAPADSKKQPEPRAKRIEVFACNDRQQSSDAMTGSG